MLLPAYYSFDFLFCIYWCWWYWASALRDRSGNCNIKFAEMEAHIQTKLLKSRRSFGYLKHSVPYNIPSGVKYNLFKGLCSLATLIRLSCLASRNDWFALIRTLEISRTEMVLWWCRLSWTSQNFKLFTNMLSAYWTRHEIFLYFEKQELPQI